MIKYLWRWHPKVALRYIPIVSKIKEVKSENPSILEVGSGSLGITPYLGKEVTGIDIGFDGPQIDLLTKVKGNALNLPFRDQSFDIILLVDVLEHIAKEKRIEVIKEAVRVCKLLLVIAVPCGKLSEEEDRYLAGYYQKVFQKPFPFYNQHLKYGLPSLEELSDNINKAVSKYNRKVDIEIKGNINLTLHRFLMRGWMTKNLIIDLIFRKIFLMLIPLFLFINQEPAYRKIFYINFRK